MTDKVTKIFQRSAEDEAERPTPESVAIVALGSSAGSYLKAAAVGGGLHGVADEIWAIITMGDIIKHDLLFHMDDCRVQEKHLTYDDEGNPVGYVARMMLWLREHPFFLTSKVYPEYPGAKEYPFDKVVKAFGVNYFNNTVAYAIAYALLIGVKKLMLFGCDFTYPDMHDAEKGRGCAEFWLGIAAARGVEIIVPPDTTLFDKNVPIEARTYGYASHDFIKGKLTRKLPEPTTLAEEIEKAYQDGHAN